MPHPQDKTNSSALTRPRCDQLPLQPHHPKGSAWGLRGADDERGTLNLLTEDVAHTAGSEVSQGRAVNLSHWDGLRHYPYSDSKLFYNGVTQDDISGCKANTKIGVKNIAIEPIVTRGILLDWYSYAQREGLACSPFTNQAIPLSHLLQIAHEAGVTFRQGDVLLIRSGWTAAYQQLSDDEKEQLGGRDDRASCGVEATEESIQWHWEQGFAAVASDTVTYEAWPSPKSWGVSMHECWDLEELSRTCQALGRWTFMLTSQPLHVPGGVASPANAMAIF
ncbi:hypothetical protein NUU61_001032 [Penicillium alfredii]|uniref:Cyclase n=1 Tax=Penicillium alfredii TaxID=1506179 RepID=A0A9W9KRL9_9EURO|nr:uncharacterized protein NUU61_001032 [Penicillium alfredii]KAJ5115273.1 hypothetical protein NUU61_001032 [Penicillium alfredii]